MVAVWSILCSLHGSDELGVLEILRNQVRRPVLCIALWMVVVDLGCFN